MQAPSDCSTLLLAALLSTVVCTLSVLFVFCILCLDNLVLAAGMPFGQQQFQQHPFHQYPIVPALLKLPASRLPGAGLLIGTTSRSYDADPDYDFDGDLHYFSYYSY